MSHIDLDDSVVQAPQDVVNCVEQRLEYIEYESVDEYITFVIWAARTRVGDSQNSEITIDQATVERRLKSLGYVNE